MPVHSSYTVQWGSSGRQVLIHVHDGAGKGITGLTPTSPEASGAYVREGEGAEELELASLQEVDADLAPGVYRLDLPDAVVAPGAPHAIVVLRFADAQVAPIDLELVAYDPIDEACIGMAQLQDRKRHEFLRRALPNLTEMEFEAGMDREKTLSDFLDERGGV